MKSTFVEPTGINDLSLVIRNCTYSEGGAIITCALYAPPPGYASSSESS